MPIPDFQALLLPVLKLAGDDAEHTIASTVEYVAGQLQLADADREAVYPSGSGLIFKDRISWARSYLKMAGLLESPRRGYLRISERGKNLLTEAPSSLNLSVLKQKYPDFREKIEEINKSASSKAVADSAVVAATGASPRDILDTAFQQWDNTLKQELLERMQQLPWRAVGG
jgi:restriction system protein